jgi:hypothetical protein
MMPFNTENLCVARVAFGGRMPGHIEVEELATSVFHHNEAVQQLEGHCRYGKKNRTPRSHRGDCEEKQRTVCRDRRIAGLTMMMTSFQREQQRRRVVQKRRSPGNSA